MDRSSIVSEYEEEVRRYELLCSTLATAFDDDYEDLYMMGAYTPRRTHDMWMSPYLRARTDTSQRNTFAKLEADFIRLGCPGEFKRATRMPTSIYKALLEEVRPLITYRDTTFRKAITAEERLSLTIRYLTRGDSIYSLSHGYLVGLSTVLPIIQNTCLAIYSVLHKDYLQSPTTEEGWLAIAKDFHDRWNMPHVLGALDGKHIRITRPRGTGSYYYNYKSFYSILLFALVDAQYRFVMVDVGAEGRSSDSTLWKFSSLNKDIENEDNPLNVPEPSPFPGYSGDLPYYFVGDDAFEMSTHLMKPYPARHLTLPQRIFNYRLSRSRRIVENAFGILSTRFRILRREIEMDPLNAQKVVMACVCLHNYLREKASSAYIPREATDWEDRDYYQHRGIWRGEANLIGGQPCTARNAPSTVKQMRDKLANWCLTREGELPYQYKVVLGDQFFFEN